MSIDAPIDDEERLEQLPEDNGPPAAPAGHGNTRDDAHGSLPVDDPRKDSDIDDAEAYDVGMDAASGSQQPNDDRGITDYNPPTSTA